MDAADAAWAEAVEPYDAYLRTIRAEIPEAVRELLHRFPLHDARVLSVGRRGDTFVISVQLDVPPNELLTMTYTLAGAPEIKQERFPWATAAAQGPAARAVSANASFNQQFSDDFPSSRITSAAASAITPGHVIMGLVVSLPRE